MRSQSSYHGYSHVQRNGTGSPAMVTVTAQPSHYQRTVFPKWLFGAHLSRLVPIPHLIYVLLDRAFADTRPHIPSTLAHKSITHTSFISNTYAIYGEAGHAPTYSFVSHLSTWLT